MKYYLVLLVGLGFTLESFSQSSLYQRSTQQGLDLAANLFEQQIFAANLYDNSKLLARGLNLSQQKQAELQRALSALQLNRPDGLGLIKKFIQDYSGQPEVATAAIFLGNYYFFKYRYAEAIEAFTLAPIGLVNKDSRADVAFKLGYSYFQLMDYKAAAGYLDQVKELTIPMAIDALYYSGYIAMEQGNNQQAIQELQLAAKSEFYASKVPYLLTSLYYKEGNYAEAIGYASPLLTSGKSFDQQESIHLFLAESHYALKEFSKAADQYNTFISFRTGELTKEEYYKAGISFFETKNYQKASEFLKIAALGNSDIAQAASYYLGHTYVQQGNFPYALASFQVASASSIDPGIQEEALFNLAKINLQRGNFQMAVNTLDDYLTSYPKGKRFGEAESLLADALLNSSDYLRVMEQLDKLKSKSPGLQQAYQKVAYYQALIYYRDQKFEQALSYLTKSQNYPADRSLLVETYFWKGEIYSVQESYYQAIDSYKLVLMQSSVSDPYFLKATYGLGYAYFNSQEYGLAEQHFQTYRSNQRNRNEAAFQDALLRLGDCYFVQKKFAQAEATFFEAIDQKVVGQDYAYLQLALVTNYQGKNQAAVEHLNQLLANFPTNVYSEDAFFLRGQIYLEELRYEEAITAFSELIKDRPNSPFLPYALEGRAVANYSLQRFSQTQADYKKILEEHPLAENSEAALKGLQEALAVQEKAEEFGEYLQNYKNTNPNTGSVQTLEYESAKSLYLSQKFPQAAKALDSYLQTYPESAQKSEAIYFAADAYNQAGDVERAYELFKLMEQQPASPYRVKAQQQLGNIALDRKEFAESLSYFTAIVGQSRSPVDEAEVTLGLMLTQFFLKDYPQAIKVASQLLAQEELIPGSAAKALLVKGKSQRSLGQYSEAEDSFGLLIQEYSTEEAAEALHLLALHFREKGDIKGSNELIFDYSIQFSEFEYWYGSMFLLLADNYLKLGEVFQAKATLQSVIDQSTDATVKEKAITILKSLD